MAFPAAQSQPLDQGPPSPQSMGAGPMGAPTPFSLSAVAPGMQTPSNELPPEILQAVMTSSQKIGSMFDSFAQVMPDLAADWGALKDQMQAVLAKAAAAGAPAMSPTASGQQFPGGGLDRGIAGAGSF